VGCFSASRSAKGGASSRDVFERLLWEPCADQRVLRVEMLATIAPSFVNGAFAGPQMGWLSQTGLAATHRVPWSHPSSRTR